MKSLLLFLLFLCFTISCSEEEKPNISNGEFLKMARKGDPDLKIILPGSISESVVECSDYTPPCRFGIKAVINKIALKALFYDHQKDALHAAKRIKGYIFRNWVLDDVAGEPILERFSVKYLKAVKASEVK